VSFSGFDAARSRYVVAHELAHQWWYASVGNDQVEEPWLDEAFAEASTRIWLEGEADGELTSLLTNLASDADPSRAAVTSGVDDFTSNEAYGDTIYTQGSEVLMELRRTVGPATYTAILREWHEEHSLGIASIEDFAATVVDVAGDEGRAFVEEWL
jgi:aminopeptidase N